MNMPPLAAAGTSGFEVGKVSAPGRKSFYPNLTSSAANR